MRSLDYAAAPTIFSDITTIVGTVTALIAACTAVSTLLVRLRARRRRFCAEQLRASWNVEANAEKTGMLVHNPSSFTYEDVTLTVYCGMRGRQARQPLGLLPASTDHLWPSADVHERIRSRNGRTAVLDAGGSHDSRPHRVQVTFRTKAGYWLRDEQRVRRVRSLVIWAERTRARTLRRYFGHRSAFRKSYPISVTVEPFDRTEELEHAFTQLAATGEPPRGREVPDVVAGPHDWIGRVARDESVVALAPDPSSLADVSPVARAALTRDEWMYAIPYVFDSVALIRNDALVTGAMPTTFAEVVASGAEALRANGVRDGVEVALQVGEPDDKGNAGDPYHMWPLFASLGGSFFGLGEKGFEDISVWRDSFIDAFVRLGQLGLNPRLSRAEALELFLAGRAPYLVSSSRALAAIKEQGLKVTVSTVPAAGELPARPLVSVYGLFIYEGAPNMPAARDLLKSYLELPRAGRDLNRYQQLVPVQEEAMHAVAQSDPVLAPYVEQCQSGMIMPSYPEMRQAWQLIGRTEYEILAGDGDRREVAAATADEGWKLLREARASEG